jgi:hypothetical protein
MLELTFDAVVAARTCYAAAKLGTSAMCRLTISSESVSRCPKAGP